MLSVIIFMYTTEYIMYEIIPIDSEHVFIDEQDLIPPLSVVLYRPIHPVSIRVNAAHHLRLSILHLYITSCYHHTHVAAVIQRESIVAVVRVLCVVSHYRPEGRAVSQLVLHDSPHHARVDRSNHHTAVFYHVRQYTVVARVRCVVRKHFDVGYHAGQVLVRCRPSLRRYYTLVPYVVHVVLVRVTRYIMYITHYIVRRFILYDMLHMDIDMR